MHRNTRGFPLLMAVCGLLLLPAALCHQLGGMEFRTALFVREILVRGPSFIPRLYGSPYFDYPPLYFLLAASCAKLTGSTSPFTLTLPSILTAMGTVAIVFLFARRESRMVAWLAGISLLVTPLFCYLASQATVDILLTFFTTLSVLSFYLYIHDRKSYLLPLTCLGLAGGVLTKGPVGAVLPLSVILLYLLLTGRFKRLAASLLTLGIFLILIAAICALIVFMAEGKEVFKGLIDAQLLDRLKDESNKPSTYYLGVFFGGFAPWSLFACIQLFLIKAEGGRERRRILLLSAIWLLAGFAIFSLARTKHSRYLLPTAPPTAVLCALFWDRYLIHKESAPIRLLCRRLRIILSAILCAVIAAAFIAPLLVPFSSAALIPILPLAGLFALLVSNRYTVAEPARLFFVLAAVLGMGFLIFCQFCLPAIYAREDARPFVEAVERLAQGRPVVLFDIPLDGDGLKYAYWSRGHSALYAADTIEGLELVLLQESPALVISPMESEEALQKPLAGKLKYLFDGKLGKRECAVFKTESTPPAPTGQSNRPRGPLQTFPEGGE